VGGDAVSATRSKTCSARSLGSRSGRSCPCANGSGQREAVSPVQMDVVVNERREPLDVLWLDAHTSWPRFGAQPYAQQLDQQNIDDVVQRRVRRPACPSSARSLSGCRSQVSTFRH